MKNKIIEIRTAGELQAIGINDDYLNDKGCIEGDFILMTDIDLSNVDFEPIGLKNNPFTGTFDGNGYEIKNLTINKPNKDNIGLFGYIDIGASIEDVKLEGGSITGRTHVGGLVGYMQAGTVTGYNTGSISSNGRSGGLVGVMSNGTVTGYNTGDVRGCSSGGLIGYMENGTVKGYNIGYVEGNDGIVGGLVGYMENGTVGGCSVGDMSDYSVKTRHSSNYPGELIGDKENGTVIKIPKSEHEEFKERMEMGNEK